MDIMEYFCVMAFYLTIPALIAGVCAWWSSWSSNVGKMQVGISFLIIVVFVCVDLYWPEKDYYVHAQWKALIKTLGPLSIIQTFVLVALIWKVSLRTIRIAKGQSR